MFIATIFQYEMVSVYIKMLLVVGIVLYSTLVQYVHSMLIIIMNTGCLAYITGIFEPSELFF